MQTTFARAGDTPDPGPDGVTPPPTAPRGAVVGRRAMAIFHLSVKTFSRSAGQNAVAAAAYRAGAKYVDQKTETVADYTRKQHVDATFIVCPRDTFSDPETLWNAAEAAEKRKNSTVAREYEIALPRELPPDVQEKLAREIAAHISEKYGIASQGSIHRTAGNPHLHLLTTTRVVTPDGFGAKTRILDDRKTGSGEIVAIKAHWANMCNRELKLHNSPARVDHRSHAERGLDALPTVHEGTSATALKKRNSYSARASENARRREINALVRAARTEVAMSGLILKAVEQREPILELAQKTPLEPSKPIFAEKRPPEKITPEKPKKPAATKKPQKTAGRRKVEAERDRLEKLSISPPWASRFLDRETVETEFLDEIKKSRKEEKAAENRVKTLRNRHKVRNFLGLLSKEMKAAERDLSRKRKRSTKLEKNFSTNVREEVLARRSENRDWSRKEGEQFHRDFHAISRLLESENPAIRHAVDAGNLDQARSISLKNREAEQSKIRREIALEQLVSQPDPTRTGPDRTARPGGPAPGG